MPSPALRPGFASSVKGHDGFILVEFLIAMALLATSFLMGAISGTFNLQTMVRNLSMGTQESLIDDDVAQIRRLAEAFTWCSGQGSISASVGGSCATNVALRRDYYFPNYPPTDPDTAPNIPPRSKAAINSFVAACQTNSLTSELVRSISQLPEPEGFSRNVALQNPSATPGSQTHVLRISYRQSPVNPRAPIERDVLILPTVAAWCP